MANSFQYLAPHIKPPQEEIPVQPQQNGCRDRPASFVFCNFNKLDEIDEYYYCLLFMANLSRVDFLIFLLENH